MGSVLFGLDPRRADEARVAPHRVLRHTRAHVVVHAALLQRRRRARGRQQCPATGIRTGPSGRPGARNSLGGALVRRLQPLELGPGRRRVVPHLLDSRGHGGSAARRRGRGEAITDAHNRTRRLALKLHCLDTDAGMIAAELVEAGMDRGGVVHAFADIANFTFETSAAPVTTRDTARRRGVRSCQRTICLNLIEERMHEIGQGTLPARGARGGGGHSGVDVAWLDGSNGRYAADGARRVIQSTVIRLVRAAAQARKSETATVILHVHSFI